MWPSISCVLLVPGNFASLEGMETVQLRFPFTGWWQARNSPARKVPSHGTHMLGTTHAIDFIGLGDEKERAPGGFATAFGLEDPEIFPSFGRGLLAPVAGEIIQAWDDIEDHEARRSQFRLLPYVLAQQKRLRDGGVRAIAGNTVLIRCARTGAYVALCHLKQGSARVGVGDIVEVGDLIGECGNSGNSTQPHLHIQVTDSPEWDACKALPMAFTSGSEEPWIPEENQVFHVPSVTA